MQRAVDRSGAPLFLLKGGTMLQYRLPGMSRTTQDIDGLVRGGNEAKNRRNWVFCSLHAGLFRHVMNFFCT
ncbi:nucleotidyl transferase AbiEii/AbiGii toxin family protein [Scrofimicrobium canadense]|uniref:nucleotidyl transferase AbiEii/AbiGii toxin family protein n=1 Tax=Scrofimicrobium canadense TaxID=2652290 RepID=UPI001CEC4B4D|nr:nucleotidyl transferase AbiEii/AbiGii toxin family protein [Scrofimicrobium canadense]